MQGVLLINKPVGSTSHDVVRQVRKLFQIRKVGHAGTLDPFATGLLLVCLGEATKIVRFFVEQPKEYVAEMKLGEATDTQDCTGRVKEYREIPLKAQENIPMIFARFSGEISQIPPMYSAKRLQGQHLYELARTGDIVERAAQKVMIYELEILEQALPSLRFRVVCSKGTYIRTLAHDIGLALGCGAHLTALTRTRIGHFSVQDAFSLEQLAQLTQLSDRERCLIPINQALFFLPAIELDETASCRLAHGGRVAVPETYAALFEPIEGQNQIVRVQRLNAELIALARVIEEDLEGQKQAQLQPVRVFANALEFACK